MVSFNRINNRLSRPFHCALKHLFHPPVEMKREGYLRLAITTVTLLSVGTSVMVTFVMQLFTPQANFLQGMLIAVGVPLLVVPPLAYWHHKVLFELETSRRKIEELSRTDGLTGLLNRRHFFEMMTGSMALAKRHGYPISLLLIDLDHFKSVNDRFGHQAGDDVLRRTASSLHKAIRSTDILGRYGGEEFVLLMPHTGGEKAINMCKRLRRELAKDHASNSKLPQVTISIGAACTAQHGYDFDRLLAEADQALYQAKAMGRDAFVFSGTGAADP